MVVVLITNVKETDVKKLSLKASDRYNYRSLKENVRYDWQIPTAVVLVIDHLRSS